MLAGLGFWPYVPVVFILLCEACDGFFNKNHESGSVVSNEKKSLECSIYHDAIASLRPMGLCRWLSLAKW